MSVDGYTLIALLKIMFTQLYYSTHEPSKNTSGSFDIVLKCQYSKYIFTAETYMLTEFFS